MRMEESREMKIGDAMELQLAKVLRTKTTMTTARIARELTSGAVKGVEGVFMRMLQYAGLTPSLSAFGTDTFLTSRLFLHSIFFKIGGLISCKFCGIGITNLQLTRFNFSQNNGL